MSTSSRIGAALSGDAVRLGHALPLLARTAPLDNAEVNPSSCAAFIPSLLSRLMANALCSYTLLRIGLARGSSYQ
jgi:hypothetical protein